MRAKNEFRLISEAYNIKLLAEKAVDGTLMCSKDCCGSPVMECKCGDDCKHCNCFMIQKAVKDFGLKSPLLEAVGHYDTHVRLSRGGKWNTHTVSVRKTDKELIQKFLDQGFKIEKPPEDGEDDPYNVLNELEKEFERELEGGGDGIDTNVNELKDIIDSIKGLDGISEEWREGSLKYLKNLKGPGGRVGLEDVDFEFVFGEEDNEEPRRSITGMRQKLDAIAAAQLAGSKHKPYVSSYVGGESDGFRKIFAVLGSDGKVVHKTRDKQEAHQWLKDNYENI
jgi:hypothetical protein